MTCCCCSLLPNNFCRGVRPAQLKSIFERPASAAAGEENHNPQDGAACCDAACDGSKGAGLTGADIGLASAGAEEAPGRQIVSNGMIWQVVARALAELRCLYMKP